MSVAILDVLDPRAVCLGVEASNSEAVITLLAGKLVEIGKVRSSYAGAVVAREQSMPTGLPLGEINVAVPHTDPEHVIAPAIALATLKTPVLFGSMDDPDERIPVRIVMALALTDKTAQIGMLQTVAGLIQAPATLQALLAAETVPAALDALRTTAECDLHG